MSSSMLAAVVNTYGPPENVQVREVPQPVPRRGQVLVSIAASAVTSADSRVRAARFPPGVGCLARLALGISGPRQKILGSCFSGTVESVGAGVDSFAPGDDVCGMMGTRFGAHAQFITIDASNVVAKPLEVNHEDAAGVLFGGTTAMYFLTDLPASKTVLKPGATILINGASGAVGTNAVQIAAQMGATVTGVTSTRNVELVRRLGAANVIDHTAEDILSSEARYDIVFDTVGNLPVAAARRLLTDDGVLLLAVAGLSNMVCPPARTFTGEAPERPEDFRSLLDRVANGTLEVVQDRSFPLEDVAQAHAHVDGGHKVGNVVLTFRGALPFHAN